MAPLLLTDKFGLVDVEATYISGGGQTSTPRAIRHGLSMGLAVLYPECKEKLRFGWLFLSKIESNFVYFLAGYLTIDPRHKERSKINQPGARAKWIWLVLSFSLYLKSCVFQEATLNVKLLLLFIE